MLAHTLVRAPDGSPQRWIVFLHGILGTQANWRGIARKVVRQRPGWGAVVVDLPKHGQSQAATPPYTVAAAAEAVVDLCAEVAGPIQAVLGHSFGGKVALDLATALTSIEHVMVVDSPPGTNTAPEAADTAVVLAALDVLPASFPDRGAFVDHLGGKGLSASLGQWLAMNLRRDEEGAYRFELDIPAIREFLADFHRLDRWPQVSSDARVRFVVGGRSGVFSADDVARARAAGRPVTVVEDAGHWVHAEAPDRVIASIVEMLPA